MSWFDQRPDDAMMGSFEAVGAEHIATVEPAQFREAMSQLGAAVHVVTTAGPGGHWRRFTATAVVSVSDQPATLLVCLNRRSQVAPILDANRVLCVNTLRAGADTIADVFAGRTKCTHGGALRRRIMERDVDRRRRCSCDAVVAFDCRVIEIKSVATHNVVFAGVVAVRLGKPGPALVYHERAYKQV